MKTLDFQGLADHLLSMHRTIFPEWLPGGKFEGVEYCCGDIYGTPGKSFRVNSQTGKWSDFAAGERGGDLVSLYAAQNNMSQKDAFIKLSEIYSYDSNTSTKSPDKKTKVKKENLIAPPQGVEPPSQISRADYVWKYEDKNGKLLFYVTRFKGKDGKKSFCPWSWSGDLNSWVRKTWPKPRPLYNLKRLHDLPDKQVFVVEGEKAADAVQKTMGDRAVVVTWPNGSNSYNLADWSVLKGRKVILWPDADEPGVKVAKNIIKIIYDICPQIKLIDVSDISEPGWDGADANFTIEQFVAWAKPRTHIWKPPPEKVEPVLPTPVYQEEPPPPPPPIESMQAYNLQALTEALEGDLPHGFKPEHLALWTKIGVTLNGSNTPIYNLDNALNVMERWDKLKDVLWYDNFHHKYLTRWKSKDNEIREWTERDDTRLARYMQSNLGLVRMTDNLINKAVQVYGHDNSRNEPRDWMSELKWDGTERVGNFMHTYLGSSDNEYSRAVSRNFWVSMVARVFRPGSKCDNMVILEGAQGKFKSTALSIIGGKWFTESNESIHTKDFSLAFQGKLLIEIAELDSFNKADTNTIKKVVSTATDRFRPPYGRTTQDYPRQCIFVGTTNHSEYLRDVTGGRRFWPITIRSINTDKLQIDREQLFAEAVHLFKTGTKWHEVPDSATIEQEQRREADVWEEVISEYVYGREETSVIDIARKALEMDVDRINRLTQMRITGVLRSLGWEQGERKRIAGKQIRLWRYKSEQSEENNSTDNCANPPDENFDIPPGF